MLYTTLHNRILRLVLAVLGELIAAAALNLFIVPLSLYTGGLLGFCQLVRTLLQEFLGASFGAYDIAGVLYFLLNIPLLMIGYRNLGRGLAVRTIICTVSYSVFYSIIPIPTQPIVDDYLTACLLGGILGVGAYSKDDVRVLCVCLSKYEIEELLHMVHSVDPHAFLTVQEGVRVFGNFPRKLG